MSLFPQVAKSYLFRKQKGFSWQTIEIINNEPEVLILEEIFAFHPQYCFFDIGANKGEYIFAATKFLDEANIRAFEPNPKLAARLRKLFPEIHVHEVALSNEDSEAIFRIPTINGQEDDTLGSLDEKGRLENETSSQLIEVSCRKLDGFSEEFHLLPHIVKIDVEGFELNVLNGAAHTIAKAFPLLLVEVEKRHYKEKNLQQLFEEIKKFAPEGKHYSVYYFDSIGKKIAAVDAEPLQNQDDWGTRNYINNFLFVPSSSVYIADLEKINTKLQGIFATK